MERLVFGLIQDPQSLETELGGPLWTPLEGNLPQREAYEHPAFETYYGGEPGGGKTDLLIGLGLTKHRKSLILRRQATQLPEIVDRLKEILGDKLSRFFRASGNGGTFYNIPGGRQIQLGGCDDERDKQKYKGRAHDQKAYDEIGDFLESQYIFINIWCRSVITGQPCRVVATGNPPTNADGEWVLRRWGPWLDPQHPYPAKSGEVRWYTVLSDEEVEVETGDEFEYKGDIIQPRSRTFIRAGLADNIILSVTDYRASLQALPEPLRSMFLRGDYAASKSDHPWQVFPTAWVEAAMARWTGKPAEGMLQTAVGVDVARGGKDKTVIAPRYANWYAPLTKIPGVLTPDGATAAKYVYDELRDEAYVNVDIIGPGTSVFDTIKALGTEIYAINFGAGSGKYDKHRRLRLVNKRAEAYWRFREALDPASGEDIMLPFDRELLADLCSVRYKLTLGGILIEKKDDIKERIGRSPDCADAVVYASVLPARALDKRLS